MPNAAFGFTGPQGKCDTNVVLFENEAEFRPTLAQKSALSFFFDPAVRSLRKGGVAPKKT